MEPKKVLLVDHIAEIGGAERSMLGLIDVASEFVNYHAIVEEVGSLEQAMAERGVPITILSQSSWRWFVQGRLGRIKLILSLPIQIYELIKWITTFRKARPDIIHFNINRLIGPVVAAKIVGIPSIMHYRDIPSNLLPRFLAGSKFFYWIMNLCDAWIANSAATYSDILSEAKSTKVYHIPNGIDHQAFDEQALLPTITIPSNASCKVLMIASLVPWKNIEGFIELAKEISEKRPHVAFLIAGIGKEKYVASLRQKVTDNNLEKSFFFLGFVENIPGLLNKVDLMVHTTPAEPFGRVFVEAMLAEVPIVTYRAGGALEIVKEHETGDLGNNENELIAKTINLIDDASQRKEMGKAGRARAVSHFSLKQHTEAVLQVYQSIDDLSKA